MITLDITDDAIKVLEVQGKRVTNAFTKTLESGLVKDGVVLNPPALGQAIRELFQDNGIRENNVVASVSGIHSIYRLTRLPKLSSDLMTEAVRREMTRLIPVSLQSVYTSWQTIPEGSSEYTVPIAAAPRENVDFMLASFKEAGITTKLIDLRPLAVARVADEANAISVNIGESSFDLVLVVNGIPQLLRSLPFTRSDSPGEEKAAELKEELERTVSFYNSSNPTNQLAADTPVFISGLYKELLAKGISYPVKELPQLLLYPDGFNADEYIANIGLALKNARLGQFPLRVNMNLMPSAYLPKRVPLFNVLSWIFVILAAIVVVFMVINVQQVASRNVQIRSQINVLNTQIEKAAQNKAEIDKLNAQLQQIEKDKGNMQQAIDSLGGQKEKLSADLGEIVSKASGNAILGSVSYGGEWKISGQAKSAELVLSYAFALQNGDRFSLVQVTSMNQADFAVWNYSIRAVSKP